MREDVAFWLFTGGIDKPKPLVKYVTRGAHWEEGGAASAPAAVDACVYKAQAHQGAPTHGPPQRASRSRSESVSFTDKDAPRDGHLALTGDPTSMLVVWGSGHSDPTATLMWGVEGSNAGACCVDGTCAICGPSELKACR